MELEIRHLRLMDMIAREGGLTAASKHLFVTQSALSHQLREMEERLGTPLFLRVKRRLLLTEAGRRLLKSARAVLSELNGAEEDVRRLATGKEGVLRISTQCNTCYHWLPAVIQKFNKKHPCVDVQINVEATRDPYAALWNGHLDLAFLFSVPQKQGLTLFPLFRDECVALLHPEHPLATRDFLTPGDFLDQNLILYLTPKEESLIFQKVLSPAGISPAKITQVMLSEAIVEMVKAGLGISVMSRWFSAPFVREKSLTAVRVTRRGLIRSWVAATIAKNNPPVYMEEFSTLVAKSALPAIV